MSVFCIKRYLSFLKSTPIKSISSLILILLAFWMSGVDDYWSKLSNFSISALVLVSLLLLLNLWLVGFRYWRILEQFSCNVPFRIAAYASLLGHFAGLFVSSLPGQALGRQSVMVKIGISPTLNSVLLAYERFLILIISGLLSVIAFSYFVGLETASKFVNQLPLLEILVLLVFCLVVNLKLQPKSVVTLVCSKTLTSKHIMGAASIAVLTFVSQLLVLGAFVIAIHALKQDVALIDAFAAAACISFAASMPLTVNGWGVREIASVYVLNFIGIPAGDALTISILIGVVSTLLIVGVYFIYPHLKLIDGQFSCSDKQKNRLRAIEKIAASSLGVSIAFLIFFQIHWNYNGTLLNINLADPFAILSLTAVVASCLINKTLPCWRIENFNKIVIVFTGILLFGFVIGVLEVGVTQWAFVGRLLGWLVLLGYLCAGYLLVAYGGNVAIRHLSKTLAIVAFSIVMWKAIQPVAFAPGTYQLLSSNFEGYSANRNTFAFQLLLVMAMVMAYVPFFEMVSRNQGSHSRFKLWIIVLGVLVTGIVWSGSRSGMLACAVIICSGVVFNVFKINVVIRALVVALSLWLFFKYAPDLQWQIENLYKQELRVSRPQIQSAINTVGSDTERVKTWVMAFRLWIEHPFFGAGLGVFFAKSREWFSNAVVVHSTPLWLLAEFGIVGVLYMFWTSVTFITYLKRPMDKTYLPYKSALLFTLLAFGVFSLFHEIFYQRILWLLLGVLMAFPASAIKRDS